MFGDRMSSLLLAKRWEDRFATGKNNLTWFGCGFFLVALRMPDFQLTTNASRRWQKTEHDSKTNGDGEPHSRTQPSG